MKKKISILIPIFNEKENIKIIYNKVTESLKILKKNIDMNFFF